MVRNPLPSVRLGRCVFCSCCAVYAELLSLCWIKCSFLDSTWEATTVYISPLLCHPAWVWLSLCPGVINVYTVRALSPSHIHSNTNYCVWKLNEFWNNGWSCWVWFKIYGSTFNEGSDPCFSFLLKRFLERHYTDSPSCRQGPTRNRPHCLI